jgi:hypothetical protein
MCNTVVRPVITIIMFSLLIVAGLFLCIWSFVFTASKTSSGLYALPGEDPCDKSAGWKDNRPFRISFGNGTKPLSCPYDIGLSVPRIIGTMLICVLPVFVIVGVLIKKRIFLFFAVPPIALLSIGAAVMALLDIIFAGRSLSWCNEGMKGATRPVGAETTPWKCTGYWVYAITAIVDIFLCVLGIIACLFITHMMFAKWKQFENRTAGVDLNDVKTEDDLKRLSRVNLFDRRL